MIALSPVSIVGLLMLALPLVPSANRSCLSPDDYEVFSAVLDEAYAETVREAYMVGDSTLPAIPFGRHEIYETALEQMQGLPHGLARSFQQRNQNSYVLDESGFDASAPVRLVGSAERTRWGRAAMDLHEYPYPSPARGVVSFSRVGFTADGQHALVHVLYECGGRCGDGTMIHLIRSGTGWVITTTKRTLAF